MNDQRGSGSRSQMTKRLIVMVALIPLGVPANAASPFPFAHDDAGRPVLEFYPATASKFTEQGHDLVRVTVKETPPGSDTRGPLDLVLIVDCQLRRLAASRTLTAPQDGAPTMTIAPFRFDDLKPPNKGMYERFVVALCDGELPGVEAMPAKSGWKHFLEGTQRALYFVSGSARQTGKYRAASVRLYELAGAQLPDGRRIDARDAVWVIDCERKLGAVAFERAFARMGDRNQTVESIGDERAFANPSIVVPDTLRFGQAATGSMQARFNEALCAANSSVQ